jgi:4-alpha-glucanotransferase
MKRRGSGILLHITSLSSPYGIGDFGQCAYDFVDFLVETKQSYWQILPVNPTDPAFGNSPYSSTSAFAGNPLLISPEYLVRMGFLSHSEMAMSPRYPEGPIDYPAVIVYKENLFHQAFSRFKKKAHKKEYEQFCQEESIWLNDYSLFAALRDHYKGKSWDQWPQEIRDKRPKVIEEVKRRHNDRIEKEKFLQYVFFKQWFALKTYCNSHGIKVIGDIPIYVAYDSADVWANPELFKLDDEKRPSAVSGVPPDFFSKKGQVWGNPVYRWDVLQKRGYDWWVQRLGYGLKLYDYMRIDHFRGFVAYWEIPAGKKTAVGGRWVNVPAEDFFHVVFKKYPHLPVIAEDLGIITADVREIISQFGFTGMRPILFAFGDDLARHNCAPHNVEKNMIVYTGTHDCNTARGWFEKDATPQERERLHHYIGRVVPADEINWGLIRLAMMTVANTVIIPLQDILGLGEEARMNRPNSTKNNWEWRIHSGPLTPSVAERLRSVTELYGRD